MKTSETIHVTAYGINHYYDKEELFDYLSDINEKRLKEWQQAEDNNLPDEYVKLKEIIYLNCVDFIRDIIGEENVDEFVEYNESIYTHINYQ